MKYKLISYSKLNEDRTNQIEKIIISFKKEPELHDVNRITEYIWLGNFKSAINNTFLVNNNIKSIVNVTPNVYGYYNEIEYHQIPLKDIQACEKNIFNYIIDGADILNNNIKKKYNTLVHCKKGHHRSAAIIAYYLIKYHNFTLESAIIYIKSRRPEAFRRVTCILKILIMNTNN